MRRSGAEGGHATVGPESWSVGVAFAPLSSHAVRKYENVRGQTENVTRVR